MKVKPNIMVRLVAMVMHAYQRGGWMMGMPTVEVGLTSLGFDFPCNLCWARVKRAPKKVFSRETNERAAILLLSVSMFWPVVK